MVENGMKINPGKTKAVSFTRDRVKDPLNYSLLDQVIPEASSSKCVRIILRSYFSWSDHVNYTAKKKAWKTLHFTNRILKKGNSNTESLAYTRLVRPILGYGPVCWDSFREGQINAFDQVQKAAAKFADLTNNTNWVTLTQCRKI